ncbi:ligase-associated DNA damage response endonuclease PdeM [Marivirga salinae]|uniref:Ligase-associated DNA damage response endonuclease PdeM n=1 Tax=Marivirga salinarum TaxID=3059078 RepID=A0AA51N9N0_9BACT|nr:ligase-associated DNA damage response endonuclease PdeM [Marivirga sp. BDSF4-3]WMN11269.1 ligase-associated DNA damage response endonuclease PdeM [Marivirga sp. BDSF4-3]
MEIQLAGEKLLLSEDKIIYWSKKQTVFIADLHLGKTTHFRKSGIAIPLAIITAEIDRIENIIEKFRPKRIFFLGDLFHSDLNHEWNIFNDFLEQHPTVEFILIKGNHDILNDKIYNLSKLKIEKEPFQLDSFILSHHPLKKSDLQNKELILCGHIHPGISIKGKGRSYLSLPCFYLEENQLIIPAFGRFTGLAKIKPIKGSSVFAVLNESVKKIG